MQKTSPAGFTIFLLDFDFYPFVLLPLLLRSVLLFTVVIVLQVRNTLECAELVRR